MKKYTMAQRAAFYNAAFPKFPPLVATERWLYGVWVLGNDYKGSGYYGAYPPAYLKRITTLFPDARDGQVLHLFSGSLPASTTYVCFDGQGRDDIVVGEAERLSTYFKPNRFDVTYADPPYSEEDALHYGTPMVNRTKVLEEARAVTATGGWVVWLDQVLPMYSKQKWTLCGTIGIVRSTNHRVRMAFLFRKGAT